MSVGLSGRDFLSLRDLTKDELEAILDLAGELKQQRLRGESHHLLPGKVLGLIFGASSTRTRVSFETGMAHLGGHAQSYDFTSLHVRDVKEPWIDTANVLSRYLDGLVVRIYRVPPSRVFFKYRESQRVLEEIASHASIPVINAATDLEHPCQVMADLMTIREHLGEDYRNKKIAMVWTYSNMMGCPPSVANSMAAAASRLGMNLAYAAPREISWDENYIDEARSICQQSGGSITLLDSIDDAVDGASVIYAQPAWPLTSKVTDDLRLRRPHRDWTIRRSHFEASLPEAIFLHSMPVHRGEEAEAAVVDGPMSRIYQQAENRMHVQKSILASIMR